MKNIFKSIFGFAKDGLSLDETRVSVLAIISIAFSIFTMVVYYQDRTIGANITSIVMGSLGLFAGASVATKGVDAVKNYFDNKE